MKFGLNQSMKLFSDNFWNALNECRHTSKQVIDTQELGVALTARLVEKKQPG